MGRYAIPEENMPQLLKKVATIQRKSEKLGCSLQFETVGEEFRSVKNQSGVSQTLRFVLIEAAGVVAVNGWRFAAVLEHMPNGNIVRAVPGVEIPKEYYTAPPKCEHCHSVRTRKNTYLLMNANGQFKQVGKSCLKDFSGMDLEAIANYFAFFDAVEQAIVLDKRHQYTQYFDIWDSLLYIVETIRLFGYRKTSNGDSLEPSTRDRAISYIMADRGGLGGLAESKIRKEMERIGFDSTRPENIAATNKALEWILKQDSDSAYLHNLKTVCALEYVAPAHFGILASLFVAYEKSQIKKDRSAWVGDVKQRITIAVKTVSCVAHWVSAYGEIRIYRILDESDNVFTWKTSADVSDDCKQITGTVKSHNLFRDEKQTELTRCRIG